MRSITVALCFVASVALAQQPAPAPAPKVTNLDLTGTTITGAPEAPIGTIYLPHPKAKFDSLLRVRMNMNDKLAASVHEM